jgi:hypothetical protein
VKLEYVALLPVQRELHRTPRDVKVGGVPKRFLEYLRVMTGGDRDALEIPPLVAINPMAKDHVTAALDALLALNADGIAIQALTEAERFLADVPGEAKATLIVMDDWMGWTNRAPFEFDLRYRSGLSEQPPRWSKHHWVSAVLWSSEPVDGRIVQEAVLTAVHRLAYVHRHGPARTLRQVLAQEGHVMTKAGCVLPALDAGEIAHTREVLAQHLDTEDMPTAIACLFGDDAANALGFTAYGLKPWAGLSLAMDEARSIA